MIFNKKVISLAALICSALSAFSQSSQGGGKVDYALQVIKYAYVDTVNEKRLTDDALRTIIKDLDPHSAYISQEEMREMNEPLVGKFEGIGIQFQILNDTLMVTQTIPGGPSEKLGIRQGDRIIKVDGVNKAGIKLKNSDVLKLLRGDKGTKVTVSILRRGAAMKKSADGKEETPNLIDFTITRDQIPLFTIDAAYVVAPKIGYIKLSRFADASVEEFKRALDTLKKKGIESLILDIQGNGGGYLNRAEELGDEFLGAGRKVVFTKGRNTPSEEYIATSSGGWEKGKLAILIDEGSASASEIVSGAVQDWDRGLIVGRRSFGKGLVQKPYQFPDGSMLRLTVAHYFTPSGRCIQKPYKLGDEDEYELDYSNRVKRGELTSADSIQFSDTTTYYTNNKRIVRGGGGIMPDLFVPLDTTPFSNFYSDLLRKNTFNDFILTYVDNNRSELKRDYPQLEDFRKNFTITQKFYDDFIANAEKLGVTTDTSTKKISEAKTAISGDTLKLKSLAGKKNPNTVTPEEEQESPKIADKPGVINKEAPSVKRAEALVRLQLKALIARELWNIQGYFQVINEQNGALKKAIEAINDSTFDKLKLAEK